MSFDHEPRTFSDYEAAVAGEKRKLLDDLIEWAHQRIEAEVAARPDANVHKRTLHETWNQVLRELLERKTKI